MLGEFPLGLACQPSLFTFNFVGVPLVLCLFVQTSVPRRSFLVIQNSFKNMQQKLGPVATRTIHVAVQEVSSDLPSFQGVSLRINKSKVPAILLFYIRIPIYGD